MGNGNRAGRAAAVALAVALGIGGLLGGGYALLLHFFNPLADEWHCVEGEAPAGQREGFYNECLRTDRPLPKGYTWDPYGNRPMSYNCDQEGWTLVARPYTRGGMTEYERDCVREGTELPHSWRVVRSR